MIKLNYEMYTSLKAIIRVSKKSHFLRYQHLSDNLKSAIALNSHYSTNWLMFNVVTLYLWQSINVIRRGFKDKIKNKRLLFIIFVSRTSIYFFTKHCYMYSNTKIQLYYKMIYQPKSMHYSTTHRRLIRDLWTKSTRYVLHLSIGF